MEPIRIGLLGLGTVGAETVRVLLQNGEEIARRSGRQLQVTMAAVRDLKKARLCDISNLELTDNPEAVISHPDIDIIVECLGGIEPAKNLIQNAIKNNKHVVTANKALLAEHGSELFKQAYDSGMIIAFEAAVAGGIPIIKTLREALAGNQIEAIAGILNGTANYILSEMAHGHLEFKQALSQAQTLGYAEADPDLDIGGGDMAHKLTIIAAIAFGIELSLDKVYVQGITHLNQLDMIYADELGYVVKQLALAQRVGDGLILRVHPVLLPKQRMLANVSGVMNAILVHGDTVGPTLYYGAGAGGAATASAVIADLVDVARAMTTDPQNRIPHLAYQNHTSNALPILSVDEVVSANYLRVMAEDRPGVLAEITRILADHDISIEAIIQKEPADAGASKHVPVVILTQPVSEEAMAVAEKNLNKLTSINEQVVRIRVDN